mgnify:CR=1 FL=1|tara:strand:- start:865 stop:1392 length:528 start_codon:yes stop_codon:yes gene_type:complete
MAIELVVPNVTFNTRRKIDEQPGHEFYDLTSTEIFADRRVVVFGVPGAFTPTCSSTHLPTFETYYDEISKLGIDDIYCISINDCFVMNAWFNSLDIQKVKALPDGNASFTRPLGFYVDKSNFGMGMRSWRYSMIVTNGIVENLWVEEGLEDNHQGDPFEVSDADTILKYLQDLQN